MEQKWNKNISNKMLEVAVMARIQARKGKKRTTYTATVRVQGFDPIARTFDTKGEAKNWAADIEKEMRMGRYCLAINRDARLRVVAPATIQKEFALLSHLFNIARREWGLPLENPVLEVSKPRIRNNRTRFLSKEEAQLLLDCAKRSKSKKLYPFTPYIDKRKGLSFKPKRLTEVRTIRKNEAHQV
ncbi:hypothetical protein FCL47_13595 [Desulfopila sp. IMCC35006]|uniref:hypothetical protein n=1 Tax=Desulfopila sp. IMCC35006 TaxID=2569542 RepID=UPI0010AC67FA|nr:hypothetical protein [Desulfopila sp. IMCC35006]TKB25567.1 hypothetical protein FCL47_13595 [Desulfopila sp. IMCC35006]